MKRKIIVAICTLVLAFGLAVPASAATTPVSCFKQTEAASRYSCFDSAYLSNSLRAAKTNCFDFWQTLIARLNKECEAKPEATSKPECSVKPETPIESEAPVVPETPVESEAPVVPETPAESEAPAPETPVESEAPVVPEVPVEVTPPVVTPDKPADQGSSSSYAQQVLDLVNEQRAANGLQSLTLSSSLSAVAQAKAQDMKDNNYFSHNSPTYGSPFDMMKTFGISYRTAGENIAMGYATPKAVVTAWMNSSGHRANILNANYTQMGIGYVATGNYWSQMFIG